MPECFVMNRNEKKQAGRERPCFLSLLIVCGSTGRLFFEHFPALLFQPANHGRPPLFIQREFRRLEALAFFIAIGSTPDVDGQRFSRLDQETKQAAASCKRILAAEKEQGGDIEHGKTSFPGEIQRPAKGRGAYWPPVTPPVYTKSGSMTSPPRKTVRAGRKAPPARTVLYGAIPAQTRRYKAGNIRPSGQ